MAKTVKVVHEWLKFEKSSVKSDKNGLFVSGLCRDFYHVDRNFASSRRELAFSIALTHLTVEAFFSLK